jgi:hypothetical protein
MWRASVNIWGHFAMELLIALGRDSVVAYQNEASAKIKPAPLGASIIRNTFVLPWEEIRDSIFGGRKIGFSNRSFFDNDREFLLTRDYRPLLGSDGEIVGIISIGWSRKAPGPEDYSDLSAIVSALGSPELPNQLCASAPLAGSSPGEPAGSLTLARRLRRFLPQRLH